MRRSKIKGIDAQKVKPLPSTRVIDELIGDEEQTEKRRKNRKKERRENHKRILTYTNARGKDMKDFI